MQVKAKYTTTVDLQLVLHKPTYAPTYQLKVHTQAPGSVFLKRAKVSFLYNERHTSVQSGRFILILGLVLVHLLVFVHFLANVHVQSMIIEK
jgi:hypothetical protein